MKQQPFIVDEAGTGESGCLSDERERDPSVEISQAYCHNTAERAILLKAGQKIGADLKTLISIVKFESFLHRAREIEENGKKNVPKRVGHPKVKEEVGTFVIQQHEETGDVYMLILRRPEKRGTVSCRSQGGIFSKPRGNRTKPKKKAATK